MSFPTNALCHAETASLIQPSFIEYFNEPSTSEVGGIVSAFSAGACVGAYGCAIIADRYGRVIGLLTGAIVAVIGTGLQAGAVNVSGATGGDNEQY